MRWLSSAKRSADGQCDGESTCKRDSVVLAHRWPSICAAYPRGVDVAADRRAAHPLCLTLLRVEFAEPRESPRTLVRSYRTVSPLPVTGCPAHRRSLSVALVRQVTPTWLSPAPCPEESRLSSTRSCRAAATRPTHHRGRECTGRWRRRRQRCSTWAWSALVRPGPERSRAVLSSVVVEHSRSEGHLPRRWRMRRA